MATQLKVRAPLRKALAGTPVIRLARMIQGFCDRGWREGLRMRLLRPEGLFQPNATTLPDRYNRIFQTTKELFGSCTDLAGVGLGCRTPTWNFYIRDLVTRPISNRFAWAVHSNHGFFP